MPTKSIRLSDEEADELQRLLAETGETEELVLRRAALRGIRDLRIEEGIRAFLNGRGSAAAAVVAGMPRAVFLQLLVERDIVLLEGPPSLSRELATLGEALDDARLKRLSDGRLDP